MYLNRLLRKADGNSLMEAIGAQSLEDAQNVSAKDIVAAYNDLGINSSFVIDGYYLEDAPVDSIISGNYNKCDLIFGVNEGEVSNLAPMQGIDQVSAPMLNAITEGGNSVYAYEFAQVPGEWKSAGFHAVHSMDIAYLFGAYDNSERFYEGGPWEQQFLFWDAGDSYDQANDYFSPEMDEDDLELTSDIMNMWVSFAADGDPSIDGVEWTKWTTDNEDYIFLNSEGENIPDMKTGFTGLF